MRRPDIPCTVAPLKITPLARSISTGRDGRPSSEDDDRRASDGGRESRVDRVPQRLLDGGNLRREAPVGKPGILLRDGDVLSKGAGAVHSDDLDPAADVLQLVRALIAAMADDVAL